MNREITRWLSVATSMILAALILAFAVSLAFASIETAAMADARPTPLPGDIATPLTTSQRLAFALTNSADPQLVTLLNHAAIDGLALQAGWSQLETQDDVYSWTALDQAFDQALTRGKRITLHVMASPRTPSWLAVAGASYYTGTDFSGNVITDVVPWDAVYLSKYGEFLQALAQHLQTQGYTAALFDVSAVVPVSEMNLVACRNGQLGNILYERDLYLGAWRQAIDAYHAAFSTTAKFISPAVNDLICAPEHDTAFYPDVMNYALDTYGNSFWMFAADLNAEGSQRTENYLDFVTLTSLGYQTIWSATNDPTNRMKGTYPTNLKAAVCHGLANGATYFEIYAVDVLNPEPAIQEALQTIHNSTLCGLAAPYQIYLPLVLKEHAPLAFGVQHGGPLDRIGSDPIGGGVAATDGDRLAEIDALRHSRPRLHVGVDAGRHADFIARFTAHCTVRQGLALSVHRLITGRGPMLMLWPLVAI